MSSQENGVADRAAEDDTYLKETGTFVGGLWFPGAPKKTDAELAQDEISYAFPDVPVPVQPFGSRVLVQVRRPRTKSAGGIIFTDDTKETEYWNTQVGKVVAMGPLAFKNRETGAEWVEGAWCKVGDFVRIPKYSGDRMHRPLQTDEVPALFVMINDLEVIGRMTDESAVFIKAYI